MRSINRIVSLLISVFSILIPVIPLCQPGESSDKTLSPYFFIKSADPEFSSSTSLVPCTAFLSRYPRDC
jgi:hypothetical protein